MSTLPKWARPIIMNNTNVVKWKRKKKQVLLSNTSLCLPKFLTLGYCYFYVDVWQVCIFIWCSVDKLHTVCRFYCLCCWETAHLKLGAKLAPATNVCLCLHDFIKEPVEFFVCLCVWLRMLCIHLLKSFQCSKICCMWKRLQWLHEKLLFSGSRL